MKTLMSWMQVNFYSNVLRRLVPLNILYPADFIKKNKVCKSLYLLHGYGGNCNDWLVEGDAYAVSQQFGICIIMPNGNNDFYVDTPRSGKNMDTFIVSELIDFTRRLLPLSDKREDTLVGGLSMGGYGALHLALGHSDIFGGCVALSTPMVFEREMLRNLSDKPVFMGIMRGYYQEVFGDDLDILPDSDYNLKVISKKLKESGKEIPKLYLACGYNDRLKYGNREYSEFLDSIGYEHIYEEGPGTHEWAFWKPFIKKGLSTIIPTRSRGKSQLWVEADTYERSEH